MPPYEKFFKNSGNSLKNIFEKINLPLSMIPIYEKISRENVALITIHEGILELLKKIRESGHSCSLCTGKGRSRTLELVKHLHIESYFSIIVCSDQVTYPKPNPESLFLIMKKLNYSHKNTIMVGDGVNDIVCAKNAGIESIAVTWGDALKEDLLKAGPNIIVDTVAQLEKSIFEREKTKE